MSGGLKFKLKDIIKNGSVLNSPVTFELLITIFYPGTRLHDGAVVIKGDKIIAASVYYTPTTKPLTGKYGFEDPAIELDINKLNCLVCLNGSYGNTLLNVYGRQYRIKSPNGVYAKENVVTSSLNPLN